MKQGNKVQATIYAQDIQAFQDKFQLSKTYFVSNAQVKFTKPQYRAIAGDVQWTINGRTRVEEVDETHTGILFSTNKARADVELQDSSSSIKATVVGQPAEKLLHCSAKTLMEKTTMNKAMKLDKIVQVSSDNEVILYLKATKRVEYNTYDYKYNIISVLNSTLHSEESTSISNLELVLPQTNTQVEEQFQTKAKRALFLPSHSDKKPNQLPLKGVSMEDDLPKDN
ncbi:hypothetical protein TIFTF001_034487 [Ficus carica]|uniref:Uncharacterized protein n=1 Tax=Ficus carica TaxID=3494 RepID=A0AA88DZZ8_FICCA|nr:hypothetical protein TIFTF001_034487 [Ficus carica]